MAASNAGNAMDRHQTMTIIAIGIGSASRATVADILAVIEDAVKKGGLTPNVLAALDHIPVSDGAEHAQCGCSLG